MKLVFPVKDYSRQQGLIIISRDWENHFSMWSFRLSASPCIPDSGVMGAFSLPSRLFCLHIFNKMPFDIFLAPGENISWAFLCVNTTHRPEKKTNFPSLGKMLSSLKGYYCFIVVAGMSEDTGISLLITSIICPQHIPPSCGSHCWKCPIRTQTFWRCFFSRN